MDFQDGKSGKSNDTHGSDHTEAAAAKAVTQTIVLQPDANDVVTLPQGVSFDNIVADGRDLVIVADGIRYVIPEGAIIVPELVVDGVTVPPLNLAALLIGNEPVPAASPFLQSSGGNFAAPEGNIQPAYGLGNLLPYTELSFDQPQPREIIPATDTKPTVIVITPDNPVGATNAVAQVDEAGLPARGSEPQGTDAASNSETTSGIISYTAPDGTSAVLINGVAITQVGQTFVSPDGVLTITSIAEGAIGFSYTLTDNLLNATQDGFFGVTVIDTNGDQASATLVINVLDDAPIAANDTDLVAAGTYGPESGNVMTGDGTTSGAAGADQQGADGASVTSIANSDGTSATLSGATTIAGLYGSLTIDAQGDYTYVRNPGTPGGVTDTFNYTLTDGDGSTSSASLTITIADSPATVISVPALGDPGTIVDESGLPARTGEAPGTDAPAPTESTSGTITFSAPDGPPTVTINGTDITGAGQVITTPEGALTITSYDPVTGVIDYTFTLGDNTAGDNTKVTFDVTVTDVDGDTDSGSFTISIVDDVPHAVNDFVTQTAENAPVTVDAFANDIQGADSVQLNAIAAVDGSLSGTGSLVYNGDGTFTYTPGPGEEGNVTFDYTITDGDGDTSTATVTISLLADSTPHVTNATALSDDDGLAGGNPASASNDIDANVGDNPLTSSEATYSGQISVDFGNDTGAVSFANLDGTTGTVGTETVAYSWNAASDTLTATGPRGVLFTVSLAPDGTFVLTQVDNVLHTPGNGELSANDVVLHYQAADSDGDINTNGTLTITFNDDVPTASAEVATLAEGATTTGQLDFVPGADGATVTAIDGTALVFGQDGFSQSIDIGNGTIKVMADGSYSFTADNPLNNPATADATFTVTDGDGDTATAAITFTITDANVPTGGTADAVVDDDGLAGGNPASTIGNITDTNADGDNNAATFSGTLTFTAGGDTPASVGFAAGLDGSSVTVGLETVTYSVVGDVLTATGPRGALFTVEITDHATGAYTVTLLDNVLNTGGPNQEATNALAAIGFTVTDSDGSTAPTTLNITFNDDAPTASAELATLAEGATIAGQLDFVAGADGATVTAIDGTILVFGQDGFSQSVDIGNGTIKVMADGSYSFTADNPLNNPVTADATFTVTDGDGDTATAAITFTITDANAPVGGEGIATLDDDGLAGGNPLSSDGDINANLGDLNTASEAVFQGLVPFTPGGDTPVVVTFGAALNGATALVGSETVTYGIAGSTLTATVTGGARDGSVLFTAQITDPSTGAYTITLQEAVMHAFGPNAENNALATIDFTITDSDGSTASSVVTAVFNDDAPTAFADTNNVTEGGTIGGNVLTDGTPDAFGADGPIATSPAGGVIGVAAGSDISTAAGGTPGSTIETSLGFLTLNSDGSYSYESKPNSTNADTTDTFTYTIQDADGDISTQTLTISVGNVAGQVSDNDVIVDESGLDGIGSQLVPNGEFFTTGQITVTGATGTLVYSLTNPSSGTFGTLTLDPNTGAYSYTLERPVTDSTGNDGRNTVSGSANGAEDFGYEVHDTAGNLIGSGTITVNVVDDVPIAVNDLAQSIAEDASAPATLTGNVMANDTQGADGAGLTSVHIGTADYAVAPAGTTQVVTANGTYTFDAGGNWTFDPNANLDQSGGPVNASFTYTLTDGDGDQANATQPISITDGAPPTAGTPIYLTVDDQNLANGSDPSAPVQDSGTIAFTPGSDSIASIVFGNTSGLDAALNWVRVDDTHITGSDASGLVVTLTLTTLGDTATVTATLSDNFAGHPLAGDDTYDLGSVGVVATDIDGSTATGTAHVAVSDDVPTVTGIDAAVNTLQVDETTLGTPDIVDLSGLFTPHYNADGPAAVDPVTYQLSIASDGVDSGLNDVATGQDVLLRVNASGNVEGYITDGGTGTVVFTLTIDANGQAELTQLRALAHSDASNPNDPASLIGTDLISLTATVTDGDGDHASKTVDLTGGLTFYDDGPSITASVTDGDTVQLITQDADTRGGAIDTATSTANFGGAFSVAASNYGADGAGNTSWNYSLVLNIAEHTPTGLTSHGLDVVLITGADGSILGRTSAGAVFLVEISASGEVKLSQYAALDHTVSDTSNYASDQLPLPTGLISISGVATITDRDGDHVSSPQLLDLGGNIIFQDDGPHAVADTAMVTEDGPLVADGNVITDAEANGDNGADTTGADGAQVAGVAQGITGVGAVDAATVGSSVTGTYGAITIDANGHFSYTLDNTNPLVQGLDGTQSLTDTFTYTLRDGDGDTSFTTVTVTINGADDPVVITGLDGTGAEQTLYESNLADGSSPDAAALTHTGSFTVTAIDGLTTLTVGGQTVFTAGSSTVYPVTISDPVYGLLTITGVTPTTTDATGDVTAATINYTYVLQDNSLLHSGPTDGSFTDHFAVVASDTDGSTNTQSLDITIVDDVPHAVADTNSVTEGASTTGNLLTDGTADTFGADGAATTTPTGGITGVRAAGGDTTTAVTDGTTVVATALGTLTLSANGSYVYQANANTISSATQDVFVYTIKDGDGDLSTTTLTIDLTAVNGSVSDNNALVNEAGLDGIGSNAASNSESFTTGAIVASGGVGALHYMLDSPADGTYGTLTLDPNTGTYSYVLDTPYSGPAIQGTDTVPNAESFGYTVTDSVGNIIGTGSIDVSIIDDVPSLGVVQSQQASNDDTQTPAIGTLHFTAGADGAGAGMTITADLTGITVGQQPVTTVQNGNVLTAYVDADGSGTFNAGDTAVFTITVDPSAGTSGQYTFDLLTPLDGVTTDVPIGSGSSFGVGPSASVVVTDTATAQNLVFVTGWSPNGGFTAAEQTAWFGGASPDLTQTTNVNGSTQGWGLANNNFDVGEFLRFDFGTLNDYDGAGGYSPPAGQTIVNASYATFSFFNFGAGETIKFVAHYTDGTIGANAIDGANDAGVYTVTAPAGSLIAWIDVYQSSGSMKLNLTNVGVASTTVDHTIPFSIQLSDGDGDLTNAANFTVHVADGLIPYTPIAPLVLDLNGNGVEFLGLDAGVTHDFGTGLLATAWAAPSDGMLAHQTATGLDIVFTDDAKGAATDLQGLALAYDSNHDGVFNAADAAYAEFGVWQDANSNGKVDPGEYHSLAEAGITAINLTTDGHAYGAAGGDVSVHGTGSYTRADGSTGLTADASFATDAIATINQRSAQISTVNAMAAAMVLPDLMVSLHDGASNALVATGFTSPHVAVNALNLVDMPAGQELAASSADLLAVQHAAQVDISSQSIGHESYDTVSLDSLGANLSSAPVAPQVQLDITAGQAAFTMGAEGQGPDLSGSTAEGAQMMDALLTLGQGAASAAQQTEAVAAVQGAQNVQPLQEAFADLADSHAVDAIVNHFAGGTSAFEMASVTAGSNAPAPEMHIDSTILNIGLADAANAFAMPMPVDMTEDHVSALAATA